MGEEEDEEEEEEKPKAKKRKADNGEESSAKKQKEQVTMMFTDVPENLNDNSFKKYLKEHDVEVLSMRANWGRQKVFADISGDDKAAALKLDQHDWDGYVISVGVDAPRGDRQPGWKPREAPAPDRDERTLFVKNLPYSTDEDTIASYFEDVKEVRLLTDRDSGRPKGMGFIEFNTKDSKEKAYKQKDDGIEIDGRALFLDVLTGDRNRGGIRGGRGGRGRGRGGFGGRGGRGGGFGGGSRGPSTPSSTLFVKGLTDDHSKQDLASVFSGASDVRIMTDRETGACKGFGYIEFDSEDSATKYYKSSKGGVDVGGSNVYVDYAKARDNSGGSRGGGFGGRGGGRGRGFGGRGRGRGRGGFNAAAAKNKGAVQEFQGKSTTFDDSD